MEPGPTNGQLALLCEMRMLPSAVDAAIIASFGPAEEAAIKRAIRWAWENRRVPTMSQARAADLLGMRTSHFSNMLWKDKYLPPQKLNQFEWVVGNTALSQTITRFARERELEAVRQASALVAERMVRSA